MKCLDRLPRGPQGGYVRSNSFPVQHHYTRAFTTEDIAVPILPAADIFDELIYESFLRIVLNHRPAKIGGEMRATPRPLIGKSKAQWIFAVPCSIMRLTPQGSSSREARRESEESALSCAPSCWPRV